MSQALRDRLILFIPYVIVGVVSLAAILFIPMRTNSWQVWFCIGVLPALIATVLNISPPFRSVYLRHLNRLTSKALQKRKPRV